MKTFPVEKAREFLSHYSDDEALTEALSGFEAEMQLVMAVARLHLGLDEISVSDALAIAARLEELADAHLMKGPSPAAQGSGPIRGAARREDSDEPSPAVLRLLDTVTRGPHPVFNGLAICKTGPDDLKPCSPADRFFYWGSGCGDAACKFHVPRDVSQDGLRAHLHRLISHGSDALPPHIIAEIRGLVDAPGAAFELHKTGILVRNARALN